MSESQQDVSRPESWSENGQAGGSDDRGLVIVNTGDGKGKSTAAFGTAIRAAGHGMRVAVIQFIKGSWPTGEQRALTRFDNITHVICGQGFTWNADLAGHIEAARQGWQSACDLIEQARRDPDSCQLLVLDEINIAMDLGYISTAAVVETLTGRPRHLTVILTGRHAPADIIALADTVTEMRQVKHAFENGIQARKGVEF